MAKAAERPVDVVTSFLGAHAFPAEYRDDRQAYVRLICEEALPAIAREGLADAVDAFCEGIAFSVAETEQVFEAAARLANYAGGLVVMDIQAAEAEWHEVSGIGNAENEDG